VIIYDLSISKKWANIPGSEYTMHICVYILFEYLKIKSKLLGSKSTLHRCDHIWLEHLKKVSKYSREWMYKTHLCPYLVWISQNREQIAREQINYTPLWSYMTWASQKVSKSTREPIYYTHLCPYLVSISQNMKQIF
jgi:hypothetical protein